MSSIYNKKINIKSFFKKIKEYELIKSFLLLNDIDGVPILPKNANDFSEEIYDFYLNLEIESKNKIRDELEKISYISNYNANNIGNFLYSEDNTYKILAQNYEEKAMVFYINNKKDISNIIDLYSFYKVSGWKRFEAFAKDLPKEKSFDDIIEEIKEKVKDFYFSKNQFYPIIKDCNMYFYDNKYYIYLDISENQNSENYKRIYFVYISEINECLIKMSGDYNSVFSVTEIICKKVFKEAIDMTEQKYNLNIFKSKIFLDGDDYFVGNNINFWRVKALNLKTKDTLLKLNFNKKESSKGPSDFENFIKSFDLDLDDFEIENISLDFVLLLTNIENFKKKISLSIKNNHANLNLLKSEHLILYKLLKDKNIFEGFVKIEL